MPTPIFTGKRMTANRHNIFRRIFYAVILGAFGYGTYKLHIASEHATRLDFWLVVGSVIAAGTFTLAEQLKARKQRRADRKKGSLS